MAAGPELERIPFLAFSRYKIDRELNESLAKRTSSTPWGVTRATLELVVPKSIPTRGPEYDEAVSAAKDMNGYYAADGEFAP